MHRKKTMNKRKKTVVTMVSIFICAALLLGASFAWTDFSQSKTNRFRGTKDPDVTLHDEFDGVNKDVFVENSGDGTVFVRVRLDEYMEISGESFLSTATVKDKTTWTPHTYSQVVGADTADCGNIDDANPAHLFHNYYKWQMTGASRNYYEGTPGLVYSKLDATDKVDSTSGPKTTSVAVAPVSMARYIEILGKTEAARSQEEKDILLDIEEKGAWLLDGDGWAYWSKPLLTGTATNLLLDEVPLLREAEHDWYYGIDVKLQAITSSDFAKWEADGITPAGKQLITIWQQDIV